MIIDRETYQLRSEVKETKEDEVRLELTILLFARTAVLVGLMVATDPPSSSVRATAFSFAFDRTGLSGDEDEKE